MSKPVAVVAAMRSELAPLLAGKSAKKIGSAELFELSSAVVVIGGIGRAAGERAVEIALREASPDVLISAGLCGALTPDLKAGDLVGVGTVIDAADGSRYRAEEGSAVLVTSSEVAGEQDKHRLAAQFGASAVDMEGAVVARAAQQHGLRFVALKAVSDELGFAMPPVNRFVGAGGKFRTGAFGLHVALRPRWWKPVMELGRNSRLAAKNLSFALQHLIEQYSKAVDERRSPA